MKSEDQEKFTKQFELHNDDCLNVLRNMEDNSVDSIVTDPPYGMKFMGKKWDYDVPSVEIWVECLRVLKPGGHLLAFAGTRTQHRMAVRIEDAGFEIRDMIAWVYGSGFPKSLDVSKAIDKAAGAKREIVGTKLGRPGMAKDGSNQRNNENAWGGEFTKILSSDITAPATEVAKQWQGWGTALKPALEPITVARKPFTGTVAASVITHGTGAINIDGCRVGRDAGNMPEWSQTGSNASENRAMSGSNYARKPKPDASGRWPANLIHDGSDEVTGLLGDAARFFYCPKASKQDRNEGLDEMLQRRKAGAEFRPNHTIKAEAGESGNPYGRWDITANYHPTVKPIDLMRYLCRLVTPPDGIVLDPFTGSGSTGKAAILEGFRFIGIELDPDYCKIANTRIEHVIKNESKND